jgi:hypothetical protein
MKLERGDSMIKRLMFFIAVLALAAVTATGGVAFAARGHSHAVRNAATAQPVETSEDEQGEEATTSEAEDEQGEEATTSEAEDEQGEEATTSEAEDEQ